MEKLIITAAVTGSLVSREQNPDLPVTPREIARAAIDSAKAGAAAVHRGHIGFAGLIKAMKPGMRIPFIIFSEICILGFFALLAWVGVDVLIILEGDTLVSLPQVPTRLTQSVIPIGAVLFFIAEALGIPDVLRQARKPDGFADHEIPAETDTATDALTEVPSK